MGRRIPELGLAFVLACSGSIGESDDLDAGPMIDSFVPVTASLRFTEPQPGSIHVRQTIGALGALVARVEFAFDVAGPITRIELQVDGNSVADADQTSISVDFPLDAELNLKAIAFSASDLQIATDSLPITIASPQIDDCHTWLDLYGLDYETGPERQGVSDPVTVTTPINGMSHRYVSNEAPRDTFFMDCNLALSLARAAPILRARDILEVVDIGVYNYRCIGGGEPPDCPSGMSQHAYANAIDIAGFKTGDGEYYSVNDDWIIDADSEATCAAPTENDKDALLHEVICELKAAGVWNIVLTPNYNEAHRNHFHVDLTAGSNFISWSRSPLVDVGDDNH